MEAQRIACEGGMGRMGWERERVVWSRGSGRLEAG
jgi:hypothetical protein